MFKLLLVAFSCLFTAACFAQNTTTPTTGFYKGDFAISGTVNFRTGTYEAFVSDIAQEDNKEKSYSLNFNPAIRYFLTDHIALGIQSGIGGGKSERGDDFESNFNNWRVGAFGNYYFTPHKKFSFLTSLGINYGNIDHTSSFSNPDINIANNGRHEIKNITFSLRAGLNYFISPHFALNTSLGVLSYSRNTSENFTDNNGDIGVSETKDNNLSFSTALDNINIGLLYRI